MLAIVLRDTQGPQHYSIPVLFSEQKKTAPVTARFDSQQFAAASTINAAVA
jgi:hypothetical protein